MVVEGVWRKRGCGQSSDQASPRSSLSKPVMASSAARMVRRDDEASRARYTAKG